MLGACVLPAVGDVLAVEPCTGLAASSLESDGKGPTAHDQQHMLLTLLHVLESRVLHNLGLDLPLADGTATFSFTHTRHALTSPRAQAGS